jgi:hypothetical protein
MSSNNSNKSVVTKVDGVLVLLMLSSSSELCESFGVARTNNRRSSVASPSPHKKRRPSSSVHHGGSSSNVVLNSFEYLGNLWSDEDYGDATGATSSASSTTTAFAEPPTQGFQHFAQPQAPPQQPLTYFADDFYYDDDIGSSNSMEGSLTPVFPAGPPVVIANPYDMTPVAQASVVEESPNGGVVDFQSLRDAAAEIIPSIAAAIPRPDVRSLASSLTRIQPMQQTKPKIKVKEPELKPSVIQGKSIRTWNLVHQTSGTGSIHKMQEVKSVEVSLSTPGGRPLNAEIELWQGPDHAPQKIAVYSEDGKLRPLRTVVVATSPQTTNSNSRIRSSTTVAVKNAAEMEFPLSAECKESVDANYGNMRRMDDRDEWGRQQADSRRSNHRSNRNEQVSMVPYKERLMWETRANTKVTTATKTVQGGASTVLPAFPSSVRSVQVFITNSDGVPVNARIEVLQGPNNIKQLIELYTEDGKLRPFGAILELPSGTHDGSISDMGLDHVLRVENTGPLEFPFEVRVEPYSLDGDDNGADEAGYYGDAASDFYYFDSSNKNSDFRSGGAFAVNDYTNPNKAYFLN